MARGHARIKTTIWKDENFVARTPEAQRVYFMLLSQPGLSFCGVIDYTGRRWAALAKGTTAKTIAKAVEELAAAEFVVLDEDHEELWVRSFVRHDGVLSGGPKLLSAMWKDFAAIASPMIRERFLRALPAEIRQGAPDTPSATPSDTPSDDGSEDPSDTDPDEDGIPHPMPRGRARPLPSSPCHQPTASPLSAAAEAPPPSAEVVPISNGHPPWLDILAPRLADLDTTGTWDLLTPYVESWDLIHDTVEPGHAMGNLIALTCDFVTRVTGEPPPDSDRSRIAMLVRSHGKAALLGYSKALGATQDETPEARFKYARGVINRFIRELEATG